MSTFKTFIFSIKFQSNFHTFFDASFWDPFFEFLVRLGAKRVDFGSPLAPSWGPNGAQNRPKGAQNRPSGAKMTSANFFSGLPRVVQRQGCFQGRFWNAPGHHFGRFWMDFGRCLHHFSWILVPWPIFNRAKNFRDLQIANVLKTAKIKCQ